jgi:uncharacterized cysteine cluster protein YcgN (CxxCxxCC family)
MTAADGSADAGAFWRTTPLSAMTAAQWESLCDGCGKCCLHKLRYPDGTLKMTRVSCRLLDTHSCRCGNYPRRKALVPDCVMLTPQSLKTIDWLPETCAYRLVQAGEDLPSWHPLKSGDPESVHRAGISMRGRCVSERNAGALENYVVE